MFDAKPGSAFGANQQLGVITTWPD
jgi:hypothetical protein